MCICLFVCVCLGLLQCAICLPAPVALSFMCAGVCLKYSLCHCWFCCLERVCAESVLNLPMRVRVVFCWPVIVTTEGVSLLPVELCLSFCTSSCKRNRRRKWIRYSWILTPQAQGHPVWECTAKTLVLNQFSVKWTPYSVEIPSHYAKLIPTAWCYPLWCRN